VAKTPSEPPFKGPWSDLPPPEPPPREPLLKRRRSSARVREPFIRNWRGLLIVLFLLFVAPWLANIVAHMIMAQFQGGGI
jgi:hypothetical protein